MPPPPPAARRLSSPEQAEFLLRSARQFDPVTDEVLPEAVALGGLIIQVAQARFPNHAGVQVCAQHGCFCCSAVLFEKIAA